MSCLVDPVSVWKSLRTTPTARLVLENGADPSIKNIRGHTTADLAALAGFDDHLLPWLLSTAPGITVDLQTDL